MSATVSYEADGWTVRLDGSKVVPTWPDYHAALAAGSTMALALECDLKAVIDDPEVRITGMRWDDTYLRTWQATLGRPWSIRIFRPADEDITLGVGVYTSRAEMHASVLEIAKILETDIYI